MGVSIVLKMKAQFNRESIRKIEEKVRKSLFRSQGVRAAIKNTVLSLSSVGRFYNFLRGQQFRGDFGISDSDASAMAEEFKREITTPFMFLQSAGTGGKRGIGFKIGNLKNLRAVTSYQWTGNKNITVSAIDIYEYGKITNIPNYVYLRDTGGYSRSGLKIMAKAPGRSAPLHYGSSPSIGALRAEFLGNAEKFALNISRKYKVN